MTNDLFKEKEETIWCMEEKFEDDRGTIDNRREKDEKKEKIRWWMRKAFLEEWRKSRKWENMNWEDEREAGGW